MSKLKRGIVLGLVTAGVGAAGVSAAQATLPGAPTCGGSSNNVCIYADNDYVGEIGDRSPGSGVVNVAANYNDTMDSWWNESNSDARWYYNANGTGTCNNLNASSRDANIGVFPSDELTSWATNGACS